MIENIRLTCINVLVSNVIAFLATGSATKCFMTPFKTNRFTYKQAERQTGRQADRQTGRQADRQTGRQADRQTGRQADKPASRLAAN